MELPESATLPEHTLSIDAPSHPESAGKVTGTDFDATGLSQQQMVDSLSKYVTAHGGNLDQVCFNDADTTKGYFIVSVGAQRTQYTFYINTRTNVVTVDAGMLLNT
jgi:hypothetical protein